MEKVFNAIDGFEYLACKNGDIFSTERMVRTFLRRGKTAIETLKHKKSKILKPYKNKLGYKSIVLNFNGKKKCFSVHRLVVAAFFGNDSIHGKEINHIDFNPSNNKLNNLQICTKSENMAHSSIYGRLSYQKKHMRGSNNFNSKLRNEDVIFIFKSKLYQKDLAKKFFVSQATISAIKTSKTFGYLTKCIKL